MGLFQDLPADYNLLQGYSLRNFVLHYVLYASRLFESLEETGRHHLC